MKLQVPASFTDPSRKEFTVLLLEDVPRDNVKFVSSDGLLIPSALKMRRTISRLVFEGSVASEPLVAAVDRQPVVPVYSVVVYDELMHARGKFGPRRADGSPETADEVWIAATTAFAPSFVPFVRAVGGLALFGITTALLQQHLSESLRSALETSGTGVCVCVVWLETSSHCHPIRLTEGPPSRISVQDQEKLAMDALNAASSRRASRSRRSLSSSTVREHCFVFP
jgi:hypothetical protein